MSNNPNATITITNKEKWDLERKAKQGWKLYFIGRDYVYDLQQTRNNVRNTAENIRQNFQPLDYEYLKQQFLEMYDKIGQLCDYLVCFETLTKEIIAIPLCGHFVCKTCKSVLNICPICRKSF